MQSNFLAGSKNFDRHKIFLDLLKDKACLLSVVQQNKSVTRRIVLAILTKVLYKFGCS